VSPQRPIKKANVGAHHKILDLRPNLVEKTIFVAAQNSTSPNQRFFKRLNPCYQPRIAAVQKKL
jgi:hypothetical protein